MSEGKRVPLSAGSPDTAVGDDEEDFKRRMRENAEAARCKALEFSRSLLRARGKHA